MNYGFWAFGSTCGLLGAASTKETLLDGRIVTHKDPDFPAVVEDVFIVNALRTSRQARSDFDRLYPTLDQVSQGRLTDLLAANKYACRLVVDSQTAADAQQAAQNTSGVRTRTPTP